MRRPDHEGNGHRDSARDQQGDREDEAAGDVLREQMSGQRARRRGADAAPAQREQDHVLDEGVGVGQGDRHDGRR
ncbi:hypothetical protein OG595_19965 [Streptomyces sp. NBC_01451]